MIMGNIGAFAGLHLSQRNNGPRQWLSGRVSRDRHQFGRGFLAASQCHCKRWVYPHYSWQFDASASRLPVVRCLPIGPRYHDLRDFCLGKPAFKIPPHQSRKSVSLQKIGNVPVARPNASASSRVICSP